LKARQPAKIKNSGVFSFFSHSTYDAMGRSCGNLSPSPGLCPFEQLTVLNGQHWKHFQRKHGMSMNASVLSLGCVPRRIGEGRMSFIFMIMAVPFLSATGIYNPKVMHHGHCIAEPGSFDALYCVSTPAAPPHRHH
jgi:hypothetical protein